MHVYQEMIKHAHIQNSPFSVMHAYYQDIINMISILIMHVCLSKYIKHIVLWGYIFHSCMLNYYQDMINMALFQCMLTII